MTVSCWRVASVLGFAYSEWVQSGNSQPTSGDDAPSTYVTDGQQHIVYRASDNTIYHEYWTDGAWVAEHLGDKAQGSPSTYVTDGQQHIMFVAADGSIHHMYYMAATGWIDEHLGHKAQGSPSPTSQWGSSTSCSWRPTARSTTCTTPPAAGGSTSTSVADRSRVVEGSSGGPSGPATRRPLRLSVASAQASSTSST